MLVTPVFRRRRVTQALLSKRTWRVRAFQRGKQISKRQNAGWLWLCSPVFPCSRGFPGLLVAVAPRTGLGASGFGFWFVLVAPPLPFGCVSHISDRRTAALEAQKQECAVHQCRSKDLAFQVSLTEAKLDGDVLAAGFWELRPG